MDTTNKGKRVKLVYTNDLYTDLKPGDMGIYQFSLTMPDGKLQHSIKWDNGSSLMLLEGIDRFGFENEGHCGDAKGNPACGFAKKITNGPCPSGKTSGVNCTCKAVAEQEEKVGAEGSLADFEEHGYINLFRIEEVGPPDAKCEHWKPLSK